jgi:hypothetical protein
MYEKEDKNLAKVYALSGSLRKVYSRGLNYSGMTLGVIPEM